MKTVLTRGAAVPLLAIALGVANAVMLLGPGPIRPTNIDWIFGDNATYYAGWALFRHDTHVSFPPAWTERIGYPVGTSIALLDALPLVAFLFRPLSPLLPEPFQYLGLYAVACFALQAYFGFALCRRLFPSHPAFCLLGGLVFLLSPPLTIRASGHTTLLTHWPLLAAFERYFRDPDERPVRWLVPQWIILAIAAGLTPYIAVMCLLIALAALVRVAVERRCRIAYAAMLFVATIGIALGSLVTFGVLISRDPATYSAPGFGLFSMNLNALANPKEAGSILLPALPLMHPWQYEGYNYLGVGAIVLVLVALVRRPRSVLWLADRRLLPLTGLALVCTTLAVSTTVSFGTRTLVEIDLPPACSAALAWLRASGRMFWPAYYLILAAALSVTFWSWSARVRVAILCGLVAVQFADLTPLRTRVRTTIDRRYDSPLISPRWKELGRSHDNLILIPPYQCDPYTGGAGGLHGYVWFGRLAAAERMRTNSYYAARYTSAEHRAHCVELLRDQLAAKLDPRSAYVITDGVLTVWALAGMRTHRCDKVDVFNVCSSDRSSVHEPLAVPQAATYRMGEFLDFSYTGTLDRYKTIGWGQPDATGTWTLGPVAMVRLGVDGAIDPNRRVILEVDARPSVDASHRRLDVEVAVNRQTIDRWAFRSASSSLSLARIPPQISAARRTLDIELRVLNPALPADPAAGPPGFIGLKVRSMRVRYE